MIINRTQNTEHRTQNTEHRTQNTEHRTQNIIVLIILLITCILIMIPLMPGKLILPNRDSGVFMYIGRQITEGAIPYKDLWDHKPPFIYYIDAIGILIADHSLWGIWLIEVFSLLTAALFSFKSLSKIIAITPAFFGTIAWLSSFMLILKKGNLTTEYAIPLIFIILWLYFGMYSGKKPWYNFLLIGMLGGVIFNLKQTTIGILIVVVLVTLFQQILKKNSWPKLTIPIIGMGFIIINLVVMGYFAFNGAFKYYIDNVYLYNFYYVQASDQKFSLLPTIRLYLSTFSNSGFFIITICGYIVALFNFVKLVIKKNIDGSFAKIGILASILIWLPVEIFLTSTSGHGALHYLQVSMPVMALITAYLIETAINCVQRKASQIIIALMLVIGALNFINLYIYHRQYTSQLSYADKVRTINAFARKDDFVLLYGAESIVNFMTYTKSPSRFIYQYPLYMPDYTNEDIINEFLSDIIEKQPVVIVDTKNIMTPFFQFPITSSTIQKKISIILSNYSKCDADRDWIYYCLIPK